MLTTATYARGRRHATISIERIDTFLEYTDTIVNFPGIVALDGDRLVLSANHARHGEVEGEPLRTFLSEDGGAMWTPLGLESPFLDAHPLTGENHLTFAGGNHGYMRDGTITHIDVHQADLERRDWNRREGPLHAIMQTADPTFRWRRWSQTGEPLENRLITLQNAPWETGSYENYARILELGDGELLTAMGVLAGAPPRLPGVDRRGRAHYDMRFSVGIIRSHDNGATWEVTAAFHPWEHEQVYGLNDRPVDEGFDEADLEIAANGDLVLIMRSGSYSPLFPDALNRRWRDLERAGKRGLARRKAAAPSPPGWRAGVHFGPRRLRASASNPRDPQPRRRRPSLGSAVRLPHRTGMLLYVDDGQERAAARGVLALRFHPSNGHQSASFAAHSARGH